MVRRGKGEGNGGSGVAGVTTGKEKGRNTSPGDTSNSEMARPSSHSPHSTGGSSGTSSPLLHSHSPPNSSNLTKVLGARRIWGTMKSCTVTAVKNAIQRLCPDLPNSLRVRRKLKTNGEKIRWWYIVHGPEQVLSILEQQWEAVKLQTSWNLEPCFAPLVSVPNCLTHESTTTDPVPSSSSPPPSEPSMLQLSTVPQADSDSTPLADTLANRAKATNSPQPLKSQTFLDPK